MICLDTGFVIRSLVKGSQEEAALRLWLGEGEQLSMCAIAWAEFLCGPVGLNETELARRIVQRRAPLTEAHARDAASLFNASGRRRGSLADCFIAAEAIAAKAPLATTNVRDFERFAAQGLRLARLPETTRGAARPRS